MAVRAAVPLLPRARQEMAAMPLVMARAVAVAVRLLIPVAHQVPVATVPSASVLWCRGPDNEISRH